MPHGRPFLYLTAVATSVGQRCNGPVRYFFFVFGGTKSGDQTVSPLPGPPGNQKPTVAAPDGPEKCETSVTRCLVVGSMGSGWVPGGEEEAMRTATSRGGRYPKIPRVPRRVASASSVVTDRRAVVASIFVPPPHPTGHQAPELERRCLCPPVDAHHLGAGFSAIRGGHTVTPPR